MKHIFFIDYENVGPNGLNGIEELKSEDEVYLFHYEGAGEVKYENLLKLAKSNARTQIIKLHTHEKNAMDFQIVAMLGHLTGMYGERAKYNIVSKDKGYESAVDCILSNINSRLKIECRPYISSSPVQTEAEKTIREGLKQNLNPKCINRAVSVFFKAKSLQDLHEQLKTVLPKQFESTYKFLKPMYKDYMEASAA